MRQVSKQTVFSGHDDSVVIRLPDAFRDSPSRTSSGEVRHCHVCTEHGKPDIKVRYSCSEMETLGVKMLPSYFTGSPRVSHRSFKKNVIYRMRLKKIKNRKKRKNSMR